MHTHDEASPHTHRSNSKTLCMYCMFIVENLKCSKNLKDYKNTLVGMHSIVFLISGRNQIVLDSKKWPDIRQTGTGTRYPGASVILNTQTWTCFHTIYLVSSNRNSHLLFVQMVWNLACNWRLGLY